MLPDLFVFRYSRVRENSSWYIDCFLLYGLLVVIYGYEEPDELFNYIFMCNADVGKSSCNSRLWVTSVTIFPKCPKMFFPASYHSTYITRFVHVQCFNNLMDVDFFRLVLTLFTTMYIFG